MKGQVKRRGSVVDNMDKKDKGDKETAALPGTLIYLREIGAQVICENRAKSQELVS